MQGNCSRCAAWVRGRREGGGWVGPTMLGKGDGAKGTSPPGLRAMLVELAIERERRKEGGRREREGREEKRGETSADLVAVLNYANYEAAALASPRTKSAAKMALQHVNSPRDARARRGKRHSRALSIRAARG